MKTTLLTILCLFILPFCVACSSPSKTPEQAEPVKAATDKTSCLAQKGNWTPVGLLGNYMCVLKAKDAGKTCSDSKECQYRCLANEQSSPKHPKKVTGACQASNNPFGCSSEIIDGVAQPTLCID